nr:disease resistance protein rga2 [Quercus suber]
MMWMRNLLVNTLDLIRISNPIPLKSLIMAEAVVSSAVEALISNLSAVQQFRGYLNVEDELGRLQQAVSRIQPLLLDAEQRYNQSYEVKIWLRKLKDAFDDADELVDDFFTESLRRELLNRGRRTKQVRIFFSKLAYGSARLPKFKTVIARIEKIASEADRFQFNTRCPEKKERREQCGIWQHREAQQLHLWCPRLMFLSNGIQHLTSLKCMDIRDCEELDLSCNEGDGEHWKGLRNLCSLTIWGIPKLKSLPNGMQHVLPLEKLRILNCPNLVSLEDWISSFTSLNRLVISKCRKLALLPHGMSNLKSLRRLVIDDCPMLLRRCQGETACLESNAADRELGFMRPLWDYRWNKNSLYKMEHNGG